MLDERFFIQQTWNASLSKSDRKSILSQIGRDPIHAQKAWAHIPFLIRLDLIREYRRSKFVVINNRQKVAA